MNKLSDLFLESDLDPLVEHLPPPFRDTPEQRDRAIAVWTDEVRPTLHAETQPGWLPPEVEQERAVARLAELLAVKDEPITVGPELKRVLECWRDPKNLSLERLR